MQFDITIICYEGSIIKHGGSRPRGERRMMEKTGRVEEGRGSRNTSNNSKINLLEMVEKLRQNQ